MVSVAGTELQVVSMPGGSVLQTINTNQIRNNCFKMSPAGNYFAVGSFSSDVKIWEVEVTGAGAPTKAKQVMIAKGHTSGIWDLDFSFDGTRLVTVSKDGSWRLHNVDVRHMAGEDVKCVNSGKSPRGTIHKVALSNSGVIACAAHGESGLALEFIDTGTGEVLDTVENAHALPVKTMMWSPDGRFLATGSDDGLVRMWVSPKA